jgi:hypothetical protein
MGLLSHKGRLINDDRYNYPFPEIIIQTTRNATDISLLGFGDAANDNGFIYFYADADWEENPTLYIGESKNSLRSRHNATHKNTTWFKAIKYPFIGIVNSPDKPWDTDTRRAIESLTVHKAHEAGFKIVNSTNSTWLNGGTVHPNVNRKYVDDVSEIIVQYLIHHTGWTARRKKEELIAADVKAGSAPALPPISTEMPKDPEAVKAIQRHSTTLLDLIEAGILEVGTTLHSTERLYPGTSVVEANGRLRFNGVSDLGVSQAGGNCRRLVKEGISNPNGWEFWATKDAKGEMTKLVNYRASYNKG